MARARGPGAGVTTSATWARRAYTALFALALPGLLLRLWWRARRNPGYARGWRERLGFFDGPGATPATVWVHAVSVGESMAAVPLIRALTERLQLERIVVTTTTPTGAETLERMLGGSIEQVYFPYDLPWVLRRFFERYRPRLLVVLETELWPNTFRLCREHDVSIVLANARLSERSLASYRRVPGLSRELVAGITFIGAQTDEDAARFVELGAPRECVNVLGSLKFDVDLPASLHEGAEVLRRELGVNRPIVMAGSTRDGEEPLVLEAFHAVREVMPAALLVIAPRHPERFDEVAELCAAAGHAIARRSERAPCVPGTDVYLVDTMGELPRFYAAADVAFVGGSLLPYGGHNVLEPASIGTPVIVGPHTENSPEICRLLETGGALRRVRDAGGLAAAALDWLRDSNERDRAGASGREVVRAHRGATARTLDVVRGLLERAGGTKLPGSAA